MNNPIRFKKYANRRLYNLSNSTYMTLTEIAEIIRQGYEIKVIDAKTKEDVTAFILTQIVLEQAKNNNTLLPTPLLHLIIQYGDNILVDFFETHLKQIVENYIAYKEAMDSQFRHWLDLGQTLTKTAQQGMKAMNPFSPPFNNPEQSRDSEKYDNCNN